MNTTFLDVATGTSQLWYRIKRLQRSLSPTNLAATSSHPPRSPAGKSHYNPTISLARHFTDLSHAIRTGSLAAPGSPRRTDAADLRQSPLSHSVDTVPLHEAPFPSLHPMLERSSGSLLREPCERSLSPLPSRGACHTISAEAESPVPVGGVTGVVGHDHRCSAGSVGDDFHVDGATDGFSLPPACPVVNLEALSDLSALSDAVRAATEALTSLQSSAPPAFSFLSAAPPYFSSSSSSPFLLHDSEAQPREYTASAAKAPPMATSNVSDIADTSELLAHELQSLRPTVGQLARRSRRSLPSRPDGLRDVSSRRSSSARSGSVTSTFEALPWRRSVRSTASVEGMGLFREDGTASSARHSRAPSVKGASCHPGVSVSAHGDVCASAWRGPRVAPSKSVQCYKQSLSRRRRSLPSDEVTIHPVSENMFPHPGHYQGHYRCQSTGRRDSKQHPNSRPPPVPASVFRAARAIAHPPPQRRGPRPPPSQLSPSPPKGEHREVHALALGLDNISALVSPSPKRAAHSPPARVHPTAWALSFP